MQMQCSCWRISSYDFANQDALAAKVFDNPWLMGEGPRARQKLGATYAVSTLDMLLVWKLKGYLNFVHVFDIFCDL